MTAKAEKKLHPTDTLVELLSFKDEDGEYFDPASIDVTIVNPSGVTEGTLDEGSLTQEDTGMWVLAWDLPSDAEVGTWSYTVKAVYGTTTNSESFSFVVNPMPYGSLSVVRDLCGVTDDCVDYSLQTCMDVATADINDRLNLIVTTPLSTVPDIINTATNLYAAGLYLQRNSPDEKEHPFIVRAEKMLSTYIARYSIQNSGLPIVIGKDTL